MSAQATLRQSLPRLMSVFRRLEPYLRKHKALINGSIAAMFAEIVFRLLEPWPIKFVFDRILRKGFKHGRIPEWQWVKDIDPQQLLIYAAAATFVFTALRALSDYANTVGFSKAGTNVLTDLRNELYRHLQRLSLSFHTKAQSGDLTLRVIADVNLLKDVVVTAVVPMVGSMFMLVGMVAVLLWMNWKLTLLALAPTPFFIISTVRISHRIRETALRQRHRQGAMAATAAESMSAIKVVQALSLEGIFADAFSARSQKDQTEEMRGSRLSARLGRTVDILIASSSGIVLWYGCRLVMREQLSAGELLIFLSYLKTAFRPVRDFAKYAARIAKASAAGERILDVLDRTPEVRDLPGAVPAPAFRGRVSFENLNFAYVQDQHVLKDISFEVKPGQHIALVGPSGIGKSTLVSLLLRLYDPQEGRVAIDGRDIREFTIDSVRGQISVVLQDTILFAASVRENLAYGTPHATPEQIERAARLANAHEFIMALPQQYETVLGERGVTLSTGQRQRIAIARAAIRQSPILVFDEPATALDQENERDVVEALRRLSQGRTTFLITHDLAHAASADLILYLQKSRVCEFGTHEQLLAANGRYTRLYRSFLLGRHEEPDESTMAPI